MVITGYRLQGMKDVGIIMSELQKISNAALKIRTREYHKLLGEEIAFICDNIALNILKRNENTNILNWAMENLNKHIHFSEKTGAHSKYNLQLYVHVLTYEEDTYFRVICQNDKLLKAFKNLEEYHLTEQEHMDCANQKTKTWEAIHKLYEKQQPLTVNLSIDIRYDKEKIVYPEKNSRCEDLARQHLVQHFLNQLSAGTQIEPYMLMKYMDEALEMLMSQEGKVQLKQKQMHLQNILLDLNTDDSFVFGITEQQ